MYMPLIFIPLGGPQAHQRSGRDDKVGCCSSLSNKIKGTKSCGTRFL